MEKQWWKFTPYIIPFVEQRKIYKIGFLMEEFFFIKMKNRTWESAP